MSKVEKHISTLQDFLPPGTYEPVLSFLKQYKVHLTIARERKSILGDYRHRTSHHTHRISVNGNLNTYSFLITLLHELAHLLTFEKYGNKVAAHGKEWKAVFGQLLAQFVSQNIFPGDVTKALLASIHNPAASSCADEHLLRTLRQYDNRPQHLVFVESIPKGSLFKTYDGRVFRMGEKVRKRYRCEEVKTKKIYLFSALYEAEMVEGSGQ